MKYKIGYTTGVFDLLHVGHIKFLEKAKCHCECLIVGICSDKLTAKLKGKATIYSEQERIAILSSIKFVDYVFIKDSVDKIKDWEKYKFNVVFHGEKEAMYRNHEVINRNLLVPLGVEFVYFDRQLEISTTEIINKIKNSY